MKKLFGIFLCAALALSLVGGAFASPGAAGEPTVTDSAEANPEMALTIDGVAMGQVQLLETTASILYDAGALDESRSTREGVSESGGVTALAVKEDNVLGVAILNTGSFVQDSQTGVYASQGLAAPKTVSLSGYDIDLAGLGSNDMGGFGAAVYVTDNAVAELNDFRVITRGPARNTMFTRFGAVVTVNDSTFYAVSDPTLQTMQGCPPGLFLEGSVRATNAVGSANVTYNDSVVVSQGWGALSTDSDSLYTDGQNPTQLHINNCYIAVVTSGYGAYSDGGAQDYFTGTCVDVPDYGAVETGSGVVSFTDCYLNAGMYGVMTHSSNSVGDIIFQNTELHVGEAGVMLRDTANTVTFDNCTIAFDGTYTIDPEAAAAYGADIADVDAQFGTVNGADESYDHTIFRADDSACIVKLIHNSDSGSGSESTGAAPTVNIQNSTMSGDILNTAAMEGDDYTATSGPAGEGVRPARSLDVTLEKSTVTGAISLGQDTWAVTHFASGANDAQNIGYAASTELGAFTDGAHGLELTLRESTWNVTRTSYLTKLTLDEGSSVAGTMTVDGVPTELAAGTYEGEIVVAPAGQVLALQQIGGELYVKLDDLLTALGG